MLEPFCCTVSDSSSSQFYSSHRPSSLSHQEEPFTPQGALFAAANNRMSKGSESLRPFIGNSFAGDDEEENYFIVAGALKEEHGLWMPLEPKKMGGVGKGQPIR